MSDIAGIRADQFAAGSPASLAQLRAAGLDVHSCEIDTRHEHGPVAERVTVLGDHCHWARLVGSRDDGRVSLVLFPRYWPTSSARVAAIPTHRTRLGWK